jgi:hypothetical protein
MKRFHVVPVVLLVLTSMVVGPARAQTPEAFERYLASQFPTPPPTTSSPSGRVFVEHVIRDWESPRHLWLHDAGGVLEPVLLAEYPRSAVVVFSPDEQWIALNDYAGSNVAYVRLFKRFSGLRFQEQESADVNGACWGLLHRLHRTPSAWDLAHVYTEALRWAPDSAAVLLVVWGHTDTDNFVDRWLCVYDLQTRQASQDLRIMNRRAVHALPRSRR